MEYLLLLNGIWVVVANWRDDLVEGRRKMRAVLMFVMGFTGLFVTISLNTGNGSSAALPFVVGFCSLFTGFVLLRGRENNFGLASPQLTEVKPTEQTNVPNDFNDDSASKLIRLMEDGYYRTEKLTLKMLSAKIDLPEYKTRELINTQFKYRNFNDYINQLRIEEASLRLSQEPDTPIQNISLDIGYRTLSSFNRAFKEIKKQTPTDYRLSHREF
mgnify:CR=1 FL=1